MPRKKPTPDRRPEDSPTAWFAVLERARFADDYALAAKAQRELERLGVRVRFVKPRAGQEGGGQ